MHKTGNVSLKKYLDLNGWNEITIDDKETFDDILRKSNVQASEFSFTNLFLWRKYYDFRFKVIDGALIMIACNPEVPYVLMPLSRMEPGTVRQAAGVITEIFRSNSLVPKLARVDKDGLSVLKEAGITYETLRDEANDDYVYLRENLEELKGKRYDGKRNHIRRLHKEHKVDYVKVSPENMTFAEKVMSEWFTLREMPGEAPERFALADLVKYYEKLECTGGILLVDDIPAGVTFGEMLNKDTAVIHFEKASQFMSGVYPAINQSFVADTWHDAMYINREQDLGLPGLRRSKQSYCPVKMIEKYTVMLS